MLHVDYIYNNNNIYASVLWLLSYLKIYSTVVSCNLCCSASSLVAFIPLVGMLSLPILFSHRRLFRLFAFAAFSSVARSISPVLCLGCFGCSLVTFGCFSAFVVSPPLSVALFVCNLCCRMLRLFGCRMDSGCCQSF